MPTPDAIHTLVDRFRANLDSYKRGTFGNETQGALRVHRSHVRGAGLGRGRTR